MKRSNPGQGVAPNRSALGALLLAAILGLLNPGPNADAVIVAGAKGGGDTTNNTTASSVNAWASDEGLPAFPFFDNIINYSDATGIYLGATSSADVWVISAKHVTNNNSAISIEGHSFTFQERISLTGADIKLMRYSNVDGYIPTLPVIPLATGIPDTTQPLVMIGIGRDRVQDATTDSRTSDAVTLASGQTGYNWTTPRIKRWGTNQMAAHFLGDPGNNSLETYSVGGIATTGYSMRFDEPQNPTNPNLDGPWLTTNEAMGSLGDSGGGAFMFDGNQWVLTGILSAIATFTGQTSNTSAFGNYTATTDISTFEENISSTVGPLIPEPSVVLLLAIGLLSLAWKRRRRFHA